MIGFLARKTNEIRWLYQLTYAAYSTSSDGFLIMRYIYSCLLISHEFVFPAFLMGRWYFELLGYISLWLWSTFFNGEDWWWRIHFKIIMRICEVGGIADTSPIYLSHFLHGLADDMEQKYFLHMNYVKWSQLDTAASLRKRTSFSGLKCPPCRNNFPHIWYYLNDKNETRIA